MKLIRTGIAALAALALSAPALAKEGSDLPVIKLTEIWSAYQAICLANPGNTDAQVAAAKASPYGMALSSDEGLEEGKFYTGPRLVLMVSESEDGQFCMVLGHVSDDTGVEDGRKLGDPKFGAPASVEDSHAMWIEGGDKPKAMHIYKVDTEDAGNAIAGFGQMTL